jgi:D-beta-D-heptose 7-phosphate kinase/D-beta-D-heptose 1-phosphate adenosyltransferase
MVQNCDQLIQLLDRWQSHRIVVVGDFMLDHYVYGHADRLSPDAPVPVLAVQREEHKPGGASNVCLDLRALRCDVSCVGVVGADHAGQQIRKSLTAAGCDVVGLIDADDRPTTVKQNLVGLAQHRHAQKMFRVDIEKKAPIPADTATRLIAQATKLLDGAAALCIEDYNKGVVTAEVSSALITAAKQRGIPVYVDPAAIADYSKYCGATCITPNRTEALLAAGQGDAVREMANEAVAAKLLDDLALTTIVLTLDKQGALLHGKTTGSVMVPTVARQVYDVTGAGDILFAMLAAARANGADWFQAVELANIIAGMEVERFGVVPIELDEVLLALLEQHGETLGKVRPLPLLLSELAAHRKQGKSIVFTNGCFDILHAGHVSYLRASRKHGDLLVVGLNSDASIRRIKGEGRPVNSEADRVMVLSELESVSYVVVFDADTPIELIKAVKPDVLAKGADYTKDRVVGGEWVEQHGGRVELIDLVQGRSTTNIIQRIEAGRTAG